jgi:hypothetical protein
MYKLFLSVLCRYFRTTFVSTYRLKLLKGRCFCLNKLRDPSVSCEVFNVIRILLRHYEPALRKTIIAKSLHIKYRASVSWTISVYSV